MTKVLAKAKAADRKQVEARIGKAPKHARHAKLAEQVEASAESTETTQIDGSAAPVFQSGFSIFNQTQPKESMMSKTDAEKLTVTKEEREAQAAARKEAKESAALAKAEAKAEKDAARLAKSESLAADKMTKAAARAERSEALKAQREARAAELAESGATYAGSMLALRDAKKTYVRSATGQLRSTDPIAEVLDAVPSVNVVKLAMIALELPENPYSRLNVGQQSMNLRNKLRFAVRTAKITIDRIAAIRDENELAIPAAELEAKAAKKAEYHARRAEAAAKAAPGVEA